jgi:MFS family permease
MLLAPVAGWLIGRYGAIRIAVVGFLLAAAGLIAEALLADVLLGLVIASMIFVLGIATIIPSTINLVGTRGGSSRAGALAINGLVVFAGASCGPLIAQLPISFAGLMLLLAVLLLVGSGLVAMSSRPRAAVSV